MDPIADLLTRIKNAQTIGHEVIEAPFSKVKFAIAKILIQNGFLAAAEKKGVKGKEKLEIKLKYEGKEPAIQASRRISKPGQRIYKDVAKIKPIRQGYGMAIISTSQGLMTDKEARQNKLGGEVLFEIW